nr:peptidyl-prolyl cis-trans isomerase FKBP42 [Ipomoea batatas]
MEPVVSGSDYSKRKAPRSYGALYLDMCSQSAACPSSFQLTAYWILNKTLARPNAGNSWFTVERSFSESPPSLKFWVRLKYLSARKYVTVLGTRRSLILNAKIKPKLPPPPSLRKNEMTGLAIGISGMRSGGRALLHVGWELAYGKDGSFSFPNVAPMANAMYEVELIGFDETKEVSSCKL